MTRSTRRRSAFTLIEVLIVVVIMAVLAATIIPQFSSSATDAKTSALKFNLQSLRSQIELYKLHHNGTVPTLVGGALPGLTSATAADGTLGGTAPDASHPYGPYMVNGMPLNSFSNGNLVTATTSSPPTAASGNASGGWLYNTTTGQIYADYAQGRPGKGLPSGKA